MLKEEEEEWRGGGGRGAQILLSVASISTRSAHIYLLSIMYIGCDVMTVIRASEMRDRRRRREKKKKEREEMYK